MRAPCTRPLDASGAAATALKPSRSIWARRPGSSHVSGSASTSDVHTGLFCKIDRLSGPPPRGSEPAAAYSRLNRPAARMMVSVGAWPSHDTTIADSAAMTSSALPTIVSSTWLRSSDEASDWPTASTARTNVALRRRSLTSVCTPTTPAISPLRSCHGK